MAEIKTQENDVFVRASFGLDKFTWAGGCAGMDRVTQDTGAMNPTHCRSVNGGLQVTGFTLGAPGLVETTVMFKQFVAKQVGDDLRKCFWDIDRRHSCGKRGDMFNAYDYIQRVVWGKAVNVDDAGASFQEDDEEAIVNLGWSAVSKCEIRPVSMSVASFGGGS